MVLQQAEESLLRRTAKRPRPPGPLLLHARSGLDGIANVFELSGVDLADVDPDDRKDWAGSIYQRFEAVGLKDTYIAFFQIQSHYTHGNWHDLYAYHLRLAPEGGWLPAVNFSALRPQPLLASLTVLADAANSYLLDVAEPSPDRTVVHDRMRETHEKAVRVGELHERWLNTHSGADPA